MRPLSYMHRIFLCVTFIAFWLAPTKFYAQMSVEWDRVIGGTGLNGAQTWDEMNDVAKCPDGNYLVIGGITSTANTPSGPISDVNYNIYGSGDDYWLAKYDPNGNKLWDRRYGGEGVDKPYHILPLSDGNYILVGDSESLPGPPGTKTSPNYGARDYWIVKVDPAGTQLWDQSYGGSGRDELHAVIETSDGGLLLGGWSNSPASGVKSQGSFGQTDYWIVKTDNAGVIQWEQTYGNTGFEILEDLVETCDGSYLLGGQSDSPIGNDVTDLNGGSIDYWIVKLNPSGGIIWDRMIGSGNQDQFRRFKELPDCTIMLAGWSTSSVGGDKTEISYGGKDYWIVNIDQAGNVNWDKTIGGNNNDDLRSITCNLKGDLVLIGSSDSDISGDKTETGNGNSDFWVVIADSDDGTVLYDKSFGGSGPENPSDIIQCDDCSYAAIGVTYSNPSGDVTGNFSGPQDGWFLKMNSQFTAALPPTISYCDNEDLVLDATVPGCSNCTYTWSDGYVGAINTVTPDMVNPVGYYEVEVCDAFGCTSSASTNVVPKTSYVFNIPFESCNPADTGTVEILLQTYDNCDSLIREITTLLPSYDIYESYETCDPDSVQIYVENLTTIDNCDSIMRKEFFLLASDDIMLTDASCNPLDTGTFIQNLFNVDGCDSTVTTVVSLLPSFDIMLTDESCLPADTGVFIQNLMTFQMCDSIVTTTITLLPSSDTLLIEASCNPQDTVTQYITETNQYGCDSFITIVTNLLPESDTLLIQTSCNPLDTGEFVTIVPNQFGCDSTITTYINLAESYNFTFSGSSCNPLDTGTVVDNFISVLGCDSIVTTYTAFLESDTLLVPLTTCDPNQVPLVEDVYINQFGCDSLVLTTYDLILLDTTYTMEGSCDMAQVGQFIDNYTTPEGCDSVVVHTISFTSIDTTYLPDAITCVAGDAGIIDTPFVGTDGCDSLVI